MKLDQVLNIKVDSNNLNFIPEERVYFFKWNKIKFVLQCEKINPFSVYKIAPLERMFPKRNKDYIFYAFIFFNSQLFFIEDNFFLYYRKSKDRVHATNLIERKIFNNELKIVDAHQEAIFRLNSNFAKSFKGHKPSDDIELFDKMFGPR